MKQLQLRFQNLNWDCLNKIQQDKTMNGFFFYSQAYCSITIFPVCEKMVFSVAFLSFAVENSTDCNSTESKN